MPARGEAAAGKGPFYFFRFALSFISFTVFSTFGVVVIAEETAADAPDHGTMPPYKGSESRLITAANEFSQQLRVGQPRPITQQHRPVKVLDDPG
jgi:hypothetical protein